MILPMAMILQLQAVEKAFGPRRLFAEATVSIAEGQRVGFVGANGAGKTTLLRMILGQESVDGGQIVFHPTTRLGYLEQHEQIPAEERVGDYLVRVSGREPWECAKVAASFALTPVELERPFGSFSGGYQMRVRLAGVLAREPNLLLLDEPTNYLDLQTVLLLEEVLRQYRGALLLVSHDREFLKNVCTHTLELEHGKVSLFAGDIEAYLENKEQRLEEARRHNKKIQAQQAHLQSFVDRFRASKSIQAQSKMKQIARLKTIEIKHSLRTVRIQLPPPAVLRKGTALTCRDLSVGYGDRPILREINIEIDRGDHVVVLGENGQGKSTFLKTLAGDLPAIEGTYKWGHNLRVAYYAQHVPQMLPKHGSAGDYLSQVAGEVLPEDLLRMAGNFLFSKDDLEKPISVLSGGERARLCLAGICLGRYDVLILDEPTNHLDFDTVEALAEALQEFPGTIFFVSHSRTFVAEVATTILEVKNGLIRRYPYPYEVYVHELKTHEQIELSEEVAEEDKNQGEAPYVRCKTDVYHDQQKEKRALERLEKEMAALVRERETIFRAYAEQPLQQGIAQAKRLKAIEEASMAAEAQWFATHDRIEALEKEMRTAKEEYG